MPDVLVHGRPGRPGVQEIATYAVGRWPVVVRMLVLLGAPPRHAQDLATTAVGAFFERCAHDEWLDLDATLVAEVVDTWERDRTAWWHRPEPCAGDLDEAVEALDVLSPAQRARVVAQAVGALTPEQLDDALGPAPLGSPVGESTFADLPRLAEEIPVGDPHVEQARSRYVQRRRGGRRLTLVAAVAGLAAVAATVTVAVRSIDPQPAPDPGAAGPSPSAAPVAGVGATARVPLTGGPDLDPVTWYDGRRIHLADRTVRLPGLVAMVRVGDGVVATDDGGRVVHVRAGRPVETLGRTTPGAAAVADPQARETAWVDATSGAVVVRSLRGTTPRTTTVPAVGATVVALDDGTVYVDSAGEQPLTRVGDVVVLQAPEGLLDVAGGTQARQLDDDLIAVSTGHDASGVTGRDGSLSDDGHYLLTRDVAASAAPLRVVVDLGPGTPLPLDLRPGAIVRDAAFDDGTVTFVVEVQNGIQYPPDRPRGRGYIPGYTLVVCDLARAACQDDVEVFGAAAPLKLAH
ncbi:hypothetical protein [Nocardioides rubriscoriae]|uniref:hypothetical protein n=1 Tax=Nocardioides rubriscoriae TaxID=642762 RepID=UPI0011E063B5|nr:hypothetical protein [Nocardioides rubriscoriae]